MKKSSKSRHKRQPASRSVDPGDILREQVAAFEKKFRRRPEPRDPLFFDPDANEPRALSAEKIDKDVFAAMQAAGTPQHIVYAFKRTGLLLIDELRSAYPADAIAEWDAAIDEYFSMAANDKHADTRRQNEDNHMSIPVTEIPGLKDMPLSAEDQRFVFACLGAIDEHLEKQPTSLRVKTELAAAVLVMGAASAFASASELDHPEEAEAAYETFVNLVVLRALELFERNR